MRGVWQYSRPVSRYTTDEGLQDPATPVRCLWVVARREEDEGMIILVGIFSFAIGYALKGWWGCLPSFDEDELDRGYDRGYRAGLYDGGID